MAEVLGAVAAGVALGSELVRIARSIQKVTKRIQHARRDVADLTKEAIIFAGLYQKFLHTCADDLKDRAKNNTSMMHLISWTRATLRGLRNLLKKVRPLQSNPKCYYSLSETLSAQWTWLFSARRVEGLRASLSVARECINAISNLICINKLDIELKLLKAALRSDRERRRVLEKELGMSLEDKIRMLEQERWVHLTK